MAILSPQEMAKQKDKFEQLGVSKVRENVKMGIYGNEEYKKFAECWLDEKDREDDERKHQESLRMQRSLKNSSWCAAIISAIFALISLFAAFYNHK